ncbi:MAG: ankyrin repeat domain-containing protein [Candidatus Xenobiia bacterium LiM19]
MSSHYRLLMIPVIIVILLSTVSCGGKFKEFMQSLRPSSGATPLSSPQTVQAKPTFAELTKAILEDDVYLVPELLKKEPELVNDKDKDGNSALHYAVWKGDIRLVRAILVYRCDLNTKNKWEFTPLHEVVRREETDDTRNIAILLLSKGAEVNALTWYGNTPLDIAMIKERTELIKVLNQYGGKRGKHALNLPPVPEFARDL